MPDYRAVAREAAEDAGVPTGMFERQIDQESGFDPEAYNAGSDATGIAQIVPSAHPDVNPDDPEDSLEYAAQWMAELYKRHGSWRRALAAYNWGPGNVGGYTKRDGTVVQPWNGERATLPAETRHYLDVILGPEWAEPSQAAAPSPLYDATYPALAQNDEWSCAPTSTRWGMTAFGRRPTEAWMEGSMLDQGVVSQEQGLLDASGAGLAGWIDREYGEYGYDARHDGHASFDEVASLAGASPVLLGGRRWGGSGHWSGVRGYDAGGDVLLLANPAPGYGGIQQTMSRDQFTGIGPCSMVVVTHSGETTVPPVYAQPGDVGEGLLAMMAADGTQPAMPSTFLPLGRSPAMVEEALGLNGVIYRWHLPTGLRWTYEPASL